MTIKKTITTLSLVAVLATTNVATAKADSGADLLGTLLGAAGGAALGSNIGKGKGRTVAIAVGTLLGSGIGNSLGKAVGKGGHRNHHAINEFNNNPYSQYPNQFYGNQAGYVTQNYPYPPVQPNVQYISMNTQQESKYCREFTQQVNIGGKVKSSYGVACLQPDGSWQIQN